MDTGGSFLRVKAAERKADHSPTPVTKVKNECRFALPLAFFKVEQDRDLTESCRKKKIHYLHTPTGCNFI
jgi:hypothetical protein